MSTSFALFRSSTGRTHVGLASAYDAPTRGETWSGLCGRRFLLHPTHGPEIGPSDDGWAPAVALPIREGSIGERRSSHDSYAEDASCASCRRAARSAFFPTRTIGS